MSKRKILKTCPECLGTKYQIGVDGLEFCKNCKGAGVVEEEINVVENRFTGLLRLFSRFVQR